SRSTPTPSRATFAERRKESTESFNDERAVNGNNSGSGNDMYKGGYSNSGNSHVYDTTMRASQKDDSAKLQYGKNVDNVEPMSSVMRQQNQQLQQQQAQRIQQQAQARQTEQTTQKKTRPLPPTPPTSRLENKELKGIAESGTVQNKVQALVNNTQVQKQEIKPNQGRTQPQPTEQPESQPQTTATRRRPLPGIPPKKSSTSLAAQASISTTGTATTVVVTAAETIKRPITAPSTTPFTTPSTSPSTKASTISSTSTSASKTVSTTSSIKTTIQNTRPVKPIQDRRENVHLKSERVEKVVREINAIKNDKESEEVLAKTSTNAKE
ncbi:2936_t:CDS:1, partial [Paraglomus occultum]